MLAVAFLLTLPWTLTLGILRTMSSNSKISRQVKRREMEADSSSICSRKGIRTKKSLSSTKVSPVFSTSGLCLFLLGATCLFSFARGRFSVFFRPSAWLACRAVVFSSSRLHRPFPFSISSFDFGALNKTEFQRVQNF